MPVFIQDYTPIADSIFLSALVAGVPLYVLFYMLVVRRSEAYVAALAALGVGVVVAVIAFGMPLFVALSAAVMGAVFGLFPIMWIVLNALFIYELTVDTGYFDIIRSSIAALSQDQRVHALLIAFSFGALIEGIAGFGTPVALTAAMMVGLGFSATSAVVLALLANTAPVAFGNLGIPIISLGGVVAPFLDAPQTQVIGDLSAMVGRQIPLLSLVIPSFLVVVLSGWRGLIGVLPAALVAGLSFASTQFLLANFLGPQLADVLAALVSLVALVALLRFWQPASLPEYQTRAERITLPPRSEIVKAWAPYAILVVVVIIGSVPMVSSALDQVTLRIPWPALHQQVLRTPPVVTPAEAGTAAALFPAIYVFDWLRAAGTLALIAGLLSLPVLGVGPRRALAIYGQTASGLIKPTVVVTGVLALAWVLNYGGLTITLGLFFTFTGPLYPFFSALIGWIGVFLTGSDTASNNLFGGLQVTAAQVLGFSPILAAATNSSGGVTAKMVSLQNLAIGAAAVGLSGSEGTLLRRTLLWSLGLAAAIGILALAQAYVLSFLVPA